MYKIIVLLIAGASLLSSCGTTKKIQTAIAKKDTTEVKALPVENLKEDSIAFIKMNYGRIISNRIGFTTFSAKIDIDYEDAEGKKSNATAHVRMYKDSAIWISLRGPLGFEGIRAYITRDSVKLLDKQNDTYTARSVAYLQDVTELPLDLSSLQDLFLGNPVFLDSNIVSYSQSDDDITLLNVSKFFKNLMTIGKTDKLILASKLDDLDELRNRTCYLTYTDYENKKSVNFSTKRHITVAEKKKLDIKLDFKQYDFNETLSFPFSVPPKYKQN
jgi:hypothetical protein